MKNLAFCVFIFVLFWMPHSGLEAKNKGSFKVLSSLTISIDDVTLGNVNYNNLSGEGLSVVLKSDHALFKTGAQNFLITKLVRAKKTESNNSVSQGGMRFENTKGDSFSLHVIPPFKNKNKYSKSPIEIIGGTGIYKGISGFCRYKRRIHENIKWIGEINCSWKK